MALLRPAPRRHRSRLIALATVAAALAAAPRAQGVAYNFDGYWGATHTEWSYSSFFGITNWTGNALPVSAYSNDIYFGAAGKTDNLVSKMDYGSFSVRSLTFRTTGSVSLSGNAIRVAGGGGVYAGSGAAYSMSNALTLNADASATNAVGFVIDGTLTSTAAISGTAKLAKYGAGTLVLNGADTYSGGTTVSAGKLVAAAPHGDYQNDAALEFAPTSSATYAGTVSGTGSLTKSGAGTSTLTGLNTYSGGTTVGAGRLIDLNPHGSYETNAALEFGKAGSYDYGLTITGAGSFTRAAGEFSRSPGRTPTRAGRPSARDA